MRRIKQITDEIISSYRNYGILRTIIWLYNCVLFKLKQIGNKETVKETNRDFIEINYKHDDLLYCVKKQNPRVFIVAGIPYYDIGGGQRCSQLAKTFNKMGYKVEYLYAFESSEEVSFTLEMPVASHLLIDDKIIDKITDKVSKNDLFIFESPSNKFDQIIDLAIKKECKIIYENIDNWETSLGSLVFDETTLKKLLYNAVLLVGTARPLVKQLENYLDRYGISNKEILYLPNAVDCEMFCGIKEYEKPKDLIVGDYTFLYYGSLWGEWFDWELIINLAQYNSNYAINIIGDAKNIQFIVDRCPSNVYFLGLKKQNELPAYLNYVDYSLLPFKIGEISDYVSPLKIFEYISMYSKVLATNLPDIQGYPNVYCGDSIEDWIRTIEDNPEIDFAKADLFVDENSWFNRISVMIDKLYPESNISMFDDNLSIIVLNYNNKNIIFKTLDSLLRFNEIYHYEIIVVDNGSQDGSYELIEKSYKDRIKLVKNSVNGCSSGRNLGVSIATKPYILFLDSDQWITNKYWLLPYENIIKLVPNIGAIGWAAGFFTPRGHAYYVVDSLPYRYMYPDCICRSDIGYLGSGGMLLTKVFFDEIEGFDVFYDPTCYEDTDISLKIRNAGKELVYCPYLGVIHLPHQTTNTRTKEYDELFNAKKNYFYDKWMNLNKKLLSMFVK